MLWCFFYFPSLTSIATRARCAVVNVNRTVSTRKSLTTAASVSIDLVYTRSIVLTRTWLAVINVHLTVTTGKSCYTDTLVVIDQILQQKKKEHNEGSLRKQPTFRNSTTGRVSSRNDVWETGPWRITAQIRVVLLIGRCTGGNLLQPIRRINQIWVVNVVSLEFLRSFGCS